MRREICIKRIYNCTKLAYRNTKYVECKNKIHHATTTGRLRSNHIHLMIQIWANRDLRESFEIFLMHFIPSKLVQLVILILFRSIENFHTFRNIHFIVVCFSLILTLQCFFCDVRVQWSTHLRVSNGNENESINYRRFCSLNICVNCHALSRQVITSINDSLRHFRHGWMEHMSWNHNIHVIRFNSWNLKRETFNATVDSQVSAMLQRFMYYELNNMHLVSLSSSSVSSSTCKSLRWISSSLLVFFLPSHVN